MWWRGHEKKEEERMKIEKLRYGKSFLERKRGEKKKKKKEEEKNQQQKRTIPFRGTEIPKEKK